MGQSTPIEPSRSSLRGDAQTGQADRQPVPDPARPVYNQYRLNQPHDHQSQAVARG